MNFKYKAYLQKFFSAIPNGERINYIFQKYVTKSLPISEEDFRNKLESVNLHYNNFSEFSRNKNIENSTYFEFGAGYDMVIPLSMSKWKFSKLICIDIRELVFPDLINDSIKRLNIKIDNILEGGVPTVTQKNFKGVLDKYFRIKYIAPLDARNTEIETNSIDYILSNATMEHIPKNDLPDILKECHRILKAGGIMSNVIDYRDHWSFFDTSISLYNYLQYSDAEWRRYNPAIMYQNRMRHKDYIEIIKSAGFEIVKEEVNYPAEEEFKRLKELNLTQYFRSNYSTEELSIKSSEIVLRKS